MLNTTIRLTLYFSDEEALTLIKKEPPLKQQQQSTQWKEIHEESILVTIMRTVFLELKIDSP